MTTPRFTLLVPVKDAEGAKTRLGRFSPDGRAVLMGAFARDAITAARRTPLVEVHVVGNLAALRPLAEEVGVTVVADDGEGDLNRALRHAAARLARPDRGIAVLLADLPCLRTDDLETALARAGRAFVADATGTGTTLLISPPGTDLDPRFGTGSAEAHEASGATPVAGDLATLRRDVDTDRDLDEALALGVGAFTAHAVEDLERHAGS